MPKFPVNSLSLQRQAGIDWTKTSNKLIALTEAGPITLHSSQARVCSQAKNNDLVLIKAPTGSGKSILQMAICMEKWGKNRHKKVIAAFPENSILNSFNKLFDIPSACNERIQPTIFDDIRMSKTDDALRWLNLISKVPDKHFCAMTHAGLLRLYKHLKGQGLLHLFDDVIFDIDEVHHVKADDEPNNIGEVLQWAKNNGNECVLATAWFGRTDGSVISQDLLNDFQICEITKEEHYSWANIESFQAHFLIAANFINCLEEVNLLNKKVIISLPPTGSSDVGSVEEKLKLLKSVEKYIKSKYPKAIVKEIVTDVGKAWFSENQKQITKNPKAFDVLINVNVGKEGMDIPWLNTVIIFRNRVVGDTIQRNGRAERAYADFAAKKVELYICMTRNIELISNSETGIVVNNELKYLFGNMLGIWAEQPTSLQWCNDGSTSAPGSKGHISRDNARKYINSIFTQDEESKFYVRIVDKSKDLDLVFADFMKIVNDDLVSIGKTPTDNQTKLVAAYFWTTELRNNGINVNDVDVNLIKISNFGSKVITFISNETNVAEWAKIRDAFGDIYLSYEAHQNYRIDNKLETIRQWEGHHDKHKPIGVYKSVFAMFDVSWNEFCNNGKKIDNSNFYPKTWQECQNICLQNGIRKFKDYWDNCRRLRLPRHPGDYYEDCPGADVFFKTEYPTEQQFKSLVHQWKCTALRQYKIKARLFNKDKFRSFDLPIKPEKHYPNFDIQKFLGMSQLAHMGQEKWNYQQHIDWLKVWWTKEKANADKSIQAHYAKCWKEGKIPKEMRALPSGEFSEFKWSNITGTRVRNSEYVSLDVAIVLLAPMKFLKLEQTYRNFAKLNNIPCIPHRHYKPWVGLDIFLSKPKSPKNHGNRYTK